MREVRCGRAVGEKLDCMREVERTCRGGIVGAASKNLRVKGSG